MTIADFVLLAQRGQRWLRLAEAVKNNEPWVYWTLAILSIWLLWALPYVIWKVFRYFKSPVSQRREVEVFDGAFFGPALSIAVALWLWITIVRALMA